MQLYAPWTATRHKFQIKFISHSGLECYNHIGLVIGFFISRTRRESRRLPPFPGGVPLIRKPRRFMSSMAPPLPPLAPPPSLFFLTTRDVLIFFAYVYPCIFTLPLCAVLTSTFLHFTENIARNSRDKITITEFCQILHILLENHPFNAMRLFFLFRIINC